MLDIVTAKEKKGSNADVVEVDDMEDLFPNRLKQHLKESYSHLLCPSALQALVLPRCSTNSRPISMSRSWNISIHFWAHCNIWKEMLIGSNSCLVLPYTCSVFQHLQPTLKGFLVWRRTFGPQKEVEWSQTFSEKFFSFAEIIICLIFLNCNLKVFEGNWNCNGIGIYFV